MKKRLGFSEAEVLSSPAALEAAPGGTEVGVSEEPRRPETTLEAQANKRRRLVIDSDLPAAGTATGAVAEVAPPGVASSG